MSCTCCCYCPMFDCNPPLTYIGDIATNPPPNTPVFRPVTSAMQPLTHAAYAADRRARTVIHIKAIEVMRMDRK